MIKRYIVLTTHGFDYTVNTENMQVLGIAKGNSLYNAVEKFKKEHSKLLEGYGDTVILYEIKEGNGIPVFVN